MPDIGELLAAEAVRRRPAHQPAFASLVARRRRRDAGVRTAALAVLLVAVAVVLGLPRAAEPVAAAPVTGTLRMVGGPCCRPPQGIAGTVWFQEPGGPVVEAVTDRDGRFALTLAPGRYEVTGVWPADRPCWDPVSVVVPPAGLRGLEVDCHIR